MGFLLDNKGKKKTAKAKESCWEVEIDTVSSCDKAPDTIDIFISPLAKEKIEYLMDKFKDIEWLAYLVGEETNIKDIYIPKQKVSAGSVTDIDSSVCNRLPIIGVIHSHHGMGNGFSGTDDSWINLNNDISLCISKEGINGQMRWKTPCGSLKIVKTIVKLKLDVDYDKEEFKKIIKKNIEKAIVPVFSNKNYYGYGNYNNKETYVDLIDDDDEDYDTKIDKYLESLGLDEDRTLEEELGYLENSGMFPEEDDKHISQIA